MSINSTKSAYKSGSITKPEFIKRMHDLHSYLFDFAASMGTTDIQKIEIMPDAVHFTVKHRALNHAGSGPVFAVDPKDYRIAPIEAFNFDSYEFDDFKMTAALFKDHQCFLDVGGNVGYHSLSLSKQFPNAQFLCFEPIPKTFQYLSRNKELNNSKNIELFNFGFSNSEAELDFFFYPEGSVNASAKNLSDRTDAEIVKARVITMDQFMASNETKVDFIKCDVEGAELMVFQGAIETLKKHRPIVLSEILRKWSQKFGYNPNEIFELFRGIGYSAYVAKNNRLQRFAEMNEATIETNFFFLPKEAKVPVEIF